MKLPYSWLVELSGSKWPAIEMGDRLTLCGTACEDIEPTARYFDKIVVGKVLDIKAISGADKIRQATVDIGKEKLDLVCGAPNLEVGQKVAVAVIGARLAGGIEIRKARIRGIESSGMICSESELGISQDHAGILVLDNSCKVGKSLVKALDYDDYIMTFELTPNRGDSMSAIGVARDIAALSSSKISRPKFKIKPSKEKAGKYIKVEIEDKSACQRYAARIIKDIKIAESPWWLKKKLLMCGIRPINNVVDISNFVMLECGQPLHAFDLNRFGSNKVVVRRARKNEMFKTLDEKEHKLSPEVLLITNGKKGVAAAGVMGGFDSEVRPDTTDILLEAAYFNPEVIRKSRKFLNMTSESQARFEKGVDPNGLEYAIDRAAYLFQELCGGSVLSGMVDCYPKKITPCKVSFRPQRCNDLLGTDYKTSLMKKVFKDLGFTIASINAGTIDKKLTVIVPTFRPDIEREVDLIEEIVRIRGYAEIPDEVGNIGPLFTPIHPQDKFKEDIRRLMTGQGFDEIMGHGFDDSRLAALVNPGQPLLKISNPNSVELNVMRNSLIPFALTVMKNNIAQRNLDLCLFEYGKVYFPPDAKGNWREEYRLLILVTGQTQQTWRDSPRKQDYYDLTGVLENLSSRFKMPKFEFTGSSIKCFDSELSFEVKCDQKVIGKIGKIDKAIAARFDVKQTVYIAELPISNLLQLSDNKRLFEALPIYPASSRDLAIVVDETVKAGDIVSTVREAAGKLAEHVSIFDLYQGKQIAKGKKSLAISISYRSSESSLEGNQVDERQRLVVGSLKKEFNAEIRDK